MKWLHSTRLSYGFIIIGNKVVFFHINNVHGGEDHTLKTGDEATFIYDDYEKGAINVQFLPTLSDFPSTSEDKSSFAHRPQGQGSLSCVSLLHALNSGQ